MTVMKEMKEFIQKSWEKAKFEKLTPIQEKAIPQILEGKDIIAESPTGTGKTLAYVLPMLQKIDAEKSAPQALILAPTRELVMQIHMEVQKFAEGSGIQAVTLIGGADMKRQIERLKKRPHVLIGSPGRVQELIKMKKIKMHEVKTIVFDEVDQLIKANMTQSLKDIVKTTLRDRQLVFFSATISPNVEQVTKEIAPEATVERISKSEVVTNVEHLYIVSELRHKLDNIRKLVHMEQVKALVFLNDAYKLDDMASKLKFRKVRVGVLHSDARKQERAATLTAFRQGKIQVLLATDIAARGLDIDDVTHVIHLDLPELAEQYVHRSGRTGRMGKAGTVLSLVTENEEKRLMALARKLNLDVAKKEIFEGTLVDKKPFVPRVKVKKKKMK
ncbi:DEAD/DEAH box helicase [Priestia taiwanensis]|uniref:DEAD/DEAH box family ATP-dependent RNA helicase n=1 Tax=Priestia taiwanensis TaxID=1347902 RepID=A0A917EMQ8_9BACI|nr:DEAD/DEAH box helicase [Priestia taiwanensis]MBM7361897.1 superfamily II DNA/RNA helicase [Priestia taiwanensis]GGE57816.1 DEAD/DEAH box family ATP-dependent RNA helicase [Priestia taiwanensis]